MFYSCFHAALLSLDWPEIQDDPRWCKIIQDLRWSKVIFLTYSLLVQTGQRRQAQTNCVSVLYRYWKTNCLLHLDVCHDVSRCVKMCQDVSSSFQAFSWEAFAMQVYPCILSSQEAESPRAPEPGFHSDLHLTVTITGFTGYHRFILLFSGVCPPSLGYNML